MPSKERRSKRKLRAKIPKLQHPAGPAVFGYGRVSTMQQADKHSPEVQMNQVVAYYDYRFKDKGLEWGGFWMDSAVSGSIRFRERMHGAALWKVLQRGDHLVVSKLDRAFRSLVDQFQTMDDLLARGVYVHMLDLNVDTASEVGRMVMGILATIAEYEKRRIHTRMTEGQAVAALKGIYPGRAPWGYRKIRMGGKQKLAWDWTRRNEARELLKLKKELGSIHAVVLLKMKEKGLPPMDRSKAYKNMRTSVRWRMGKELGLIAFCQARAKLLGLTDPDSVPPPTTYELTRMRGQHVSKLGMVLDSFVALGKAEEEGEVGHLGGGDNGSLPGTDVGGGT